MTGKCRLRQGRDAEFNTDNAARPNAVLYNTGMLNATVTMQEGQMQAQATQMNANTDECRLSYKKTGWLKQDRGN